MAANTMFDAQKPIYGVGKRFTKRPRLVPQFAARLGIVEEHWSRRKPQPLEIKEWLAVNDPRETLV